MTVTTRRTCGSCAAYAPHLMPDLASFAAAEGPPLAGLGLAISGGYTDEELASAMRAVTVPPAVDLGLRFPDLPRGGNLEIHGCIFMQWLEGEEFPGTPNPDCPALRGLRDEMKLVPLMPIVDLPATGDYWVRVEHLWLLLRRLAVGDIDVGALPRLEKWPHPEREPIPYRRPKGRGDVTPSHVCAFAKGFPKLAKVLRTEIPWSGAGGALSAPATAANAVARELLGIRVDLRVGSLVSAGWISDAIEQAGGTVEFGGDESLIGRIAGRFERELPWVDGRHVGRRAGKLDGAAWSCAVDALLSPAASGSKG